MSGATHEVASVDLVKIPNSADEKPKTLMNEITIPAIDNSEKSNIEEMQAGVKAGVEWAKTKGGPGITAVKSIDPSQLEFTSTIRGGRLFCPASMCRQFIFDELFAGAPRSRAYVLGWLRGVQDLG